MEDIRKYSVYPSNLDIRLSCKKLRDYFDRSKYTENNESCTRNVHYKIYISKERTLNTKDYSEFMQAMEQYPNTSHIFVHSHWVGNNGVSFQCEIAITTSHLEVSIKADDLNIISAIHDNIRDIFQASNPQSEEIKRRARYNVKKSVFLAYRFDDCGTATAKELKEFLKGLGFHVLEGEGYEAKNIPAKIEQRIRSQDIFICLVTPGDPSWIQSEASFAKALNKYLIILFQDDATFNKGIIGNDYEHLTFPKDRIEKVYTDLLHNLPI